MKSTKRWIIVVLVLAALVVCAVGVRAIIKRSLFSAPPVRSAVFDGTTVTYDGPGALAVIVEITKDGKTEPWGWAMLGDSGGRVTVGKEFPAGAEPVFQVALDADIVSLDAAGETTRAQGTLRGLSGALSGEGKLSFKSGTATRMLKGPEVKGAKEIRVSREGGALQVEVGK